jgi:hypothetical protein
MPIPLNAEDYSGRYRNLRPEKKKNLVCDMMVQAIQNPPNQKYKILPTN